MFQEQTFTTSYGTLNYAQGPFNGPPLVLFHGVNRGWQDWMMLLPALAARWQVYALDFRGHGKSSRVAGQYRVVDYVEDAREFVWKICSQPPVLLGHSLGAMVALAVAAEPALRVRGAILEDPPFDTMGENISHTPFHSLFLGMQQVLESRRGVTDLAHGLAEIEVTGPGTKGPVKLGQVRDATALRFGAKCLSRIDPEVLQPIVAGEWLRGYDLLELVSQVTCPVLLLQADMDAGGMLMEQNADLIESALADCSRIKLNGVGHLIHWMKTSAMLRMVTGFLESL